jgi:hypothetical protein
VVALIAAVAEGVLEEAVEALTIVEVVARVEDMIIEAVNEEVGEAAMTVMVVVAEGEVAMTVMVVVVGAVAVLIAVAEEAVAEVGAD